MSCHRGRLAMPTRLATLLALLVLPLLLASAASEDERVELDADDECSSGACGLHAIQVRGAQRVNFTGSSAKHLRRRRRTVYMYPATKSERRDVQPTHCGEEKLKAGRQGCCGGMSFDLGTSACCGQVPYIFDQLACCFHGDGTATLYDPYSQNCCDDPMKDNTGGGICEVARGENSCCNLVKHTHRRRRRSKKSKRKSRRHHRSSLLQRTDEPDDDDEDEDDSVHHDGSEDLMDRGQRVL